jgi:ankyrin repeat protein
MATPGPLLARAAEAGDAQLVARLLGEGRDVNETGNTALIWAASLGRADVVRLLLARKCVEVNKSAADGFTARLIASDDGHVEVVQLLLARKDVEDNKTAADGATALYIASQNGHVEVMRLSPRC